MSNNSYTPRRGAYDVSWNGIGFGNVGEVHPDLKLMLEPITRGTTGKIVLGHWIIGLDGTVKVTAQDVSRLLLETAVPWFAGVANTDSIPLTPSAVNTNLYAYAQELVLHPRGAPNAKQDLHLVKAVPMTPVNLKLDGVKDDVWLIEFMFYPDVSSLQSSGTLSYGYVGDTAL